MLHGFIMVSSTFSRGWWSGDRGEPSPLNYATGYRAETREPSLCRISSVVVENVGSERRQKGAGEATAHELRWESGMRHVFKCLGHVR